MNMFLSFTVGLSAFETRVVEPGIVRVGDEVRVLELGEGKVHRALSDKPL